MVVKFFSYLSFLYNIQSLCYSCLVVTATLKIISAFRQLKSFGIRDEDIVDIVQVQLYFLIKGCNAQDVIRFLKYSLQNLLRHLLSYSPGTVMIQSFFSGMIIAMVRHNNDLFFKAIRPSPAAAKRA